MSGAVRCALNPRAEGAALGHSATEDPIRMSRTRERCPRCSQGLVVSRFDTSFRLDDASERLCFAIPGSLCEACVQLYVDPDLLELLDLDRAVCTFAIESDLVLQERAWSSG